MLRPDSCLLSVLQSVAVALGFNRQVFKSLMEVAFYTSQRSNNDWNNNCCLLLSQPKEHYGQVFIMINLLSVLALALNIDIPRHSYIRDFYPMCSPLCRLEQCRGGGGEWSGQCTCIFWSPLEFWKFSFIIIFISNHTLHCKIYI